MSDAAISVAPTPADRIEVIRRHQGRLKGWICEQMGWSRDTYQRISAGERDLTVSEAVRLGEVLAVDPATFLPTPEPSDA